MTTIGFQTTQNVFVEYPAATLGDRILASLLDRLILVVYVVATLLILTEGFELEDDSLGIAMLLLMLPAFFYSLLFELFLNGQTPGKMVLQTKVMRMDGREPTLGNYLIRWLLRIVDIWLMGGVIGLVVIASNGQGQRLGDMAAGTTVIRLRRRTPVSQTFVADKFSDKPDYIPVIPQVEQLNDQHAAVIREVLFTYQQEHNYDVVDRLDKKLRTLLNVNPDMPPLDFLRTIYKDYLELHSKNRV
jgi:uncharacterized RDD family membrane protein YckC